jgi:S-adenosylmethionine:tRNA ribosyltransferase-isomerase
MHAEQYAVAQETVDALHRARAEGARITAVGTTSLRVLETLALGGSFCAGKGETRLFITPGFVFRVVDRLLTNFHLPKSTLYMLVSAFAGVEDIRRAYRHAILHRYRFYSYGDAMLMERTRP